MKTRCSPLIANPESTHGPQCRREHGPASGQPPLPLSHPPPRTAGIFVPWDLQTRGPQSEKPPFPTCLLASELLLTQLSDVGWAPGQVTLKHPPLPPATPSVYGHCDDGASLNTRPLCLHHAHYFMYSTTEKRLHRKALMAMIQREKGAPQDRGDQARNTEGSRDSP